MSQSETSANAYLRTRILSATPEQLRLMLLDGAIKFASQARHGIEAGDHEAIYNGISRCRSIVVELLSTIRADVDAEIADRVRAVYSFLVTELIEVGLEKEIARLDGVIRILEYERETWVMAMEKFAGERQPATDRTTTEAPVHPPAHPPAQPAGDDRLAGPRRTPISLQA